MVPWWCQAGLNETEGRFKEQALKIGPFFLLVDKDEAIARHDHDDEEKLPL